MQNYDAYDFTHQRDNTRKRGGCLTIWLIFGFVGSVENVIGYFFSTSTQETSYPDAPTGIFFIFGVLSLIQLFVFIGIWNWNRLAVNGWIAIAIFSVVLTIILGDVPLAIGSFIMSMFIFMIVMNGKWEMFE